ncbi:MAG TPA: FISUMP domain-containing protein [Saprospiraceae bacterium]|nr:FISUMP domain-containing protein [Saprospiraceae bacterium]
MRSIAFILALCLPMFLTGQTVKDVDGNVYKTVKIGDQTWMAENLRVTKTSDGTSIVSWAPQDLESSVAEYGRMYDWETANKVCPSGWHLPSDEEWQKMIDFLGGPMIAGGKIKEAGTDHWKTPNKGATNETGFTALPNGFRNKKGKYFNFKNNLAYWWSSTPMETDLAYGVYITYGEPIIYRYYFSFTRDMGFSVRCVKD